MRKVLAVPLNSSVEPRPIQVSGIGKGNIRKFQEVMSQTTSQLGGGVIGPDLYPQLIKLQSGILSGKSFNPRELLGYQIMAGQFNLRVEMLSKIAESASAAVKKFQTPQ